MDYTKILNVISSAIASSFLSEEKQGSLSKQLERIKKRISDNKIYLGIVGEFSTGKSTLINSLIGEDFFCNECNTRYYNDNYEVRVWEKDRSKDRVYFRRSASI